MILVDDSVNTMMEDLLASYEHGVTSITPFLSVAALLLDTNSEQDADRIQLRETLARNGNLRKTDFDRMMSAVAESGNDRGKGLCLLLRDFLISQQEMIEQLGGHFAQIRACMKSGDIENIKRAFTRIKKVVAQQEQARQKLESKLAEQEDNQQEIRTGIKSLLQKGRELQVRDFKEMLVGTKRRSKDRIEQNRLRRETVSQMLAGYKEQRLISENKRRTQ